MGVEPPTLTPTLLLMGSRLVECVGVHPSTLTTELLYFYVLGRVMCGMGVHPSTLTPILLLCIGKWDIWDGSPSLYPHSCTPSMYWEVGYVGWDSIPLPSLLCTFYVLGSRMCGMGVHPSSLTPVLPLLGRRIWSYSPLIGSVLCGLTTSSHRGGEGEGVHLPPHSRTLHVDNST